MTAKKAPAKRPHARTGKAFVPTETDRALVEALHGCGLPLDDVCLNITNPATGCPITKPTLIKNFRAELDRAQAKANAKILTTAFRIATDPKHPKCASMNIFWQKSRMGFSERTVLEHTGPDGAPLGLTVNFVKAKD